MHDLVVLHQSMLPEVAGNIEENQQRLDSDARYWPLYNHPKGLNFSLIFCL